MFDVVMYAAKSTSGESADAQAREALKSVTVRNLIGLYKEARTVCLLFW